MIRKLPLTFLIVASLSFFSPTESFKLGNLDFSSLLGTSSATLKYGEACSWAAEQTRQNNGKLLAEGNLSGYLQNTLAFLMSGKKWCDAAELYVCDRESQQCVCGDPGFESYMGVNRSLYVLEGGAKCRWNIGAFCTPTEIKLIGTFTNTKCKLGTSCKTRDGELCSFRYFSQHSRKYLASTLAGNSNTSPDEMLTQIQKRKLLEGLAGGICSCQSDDEGPADSSQALAGPGKSVAEVNNEEANYVDAAHHQISEKRVDPDENDHRHSRDSKNPASLLTLKRPMYFLIFFIVIFTLIK